MSSVRRLFVALCLLLISSHWCVQGKIRGSFPTDDKQQSLQFDEHDAPYSQTRYLKRHQMRHHKTKHKGTPKVDDAETDAVTEHAVEPETEHPAETEHPIVSEPEHPPETEQPTSEETEYPVEVAPKEAKSSNSRSSKSKNGKLKSGKSSSKSAKYKGVAAPDSKNHPKADFNDEGGDEYEYEYEYVSGKSKYKSKSKSAKRGMKHKGGKSKESHKEYHYEKKVKSKSNYDHEGGYDKDKHKLKKSSVDHLYDTESPTLHPTDPVHTPIPGVGPETVPPHSGTEPSLVEVPISIYFSFEEQPQKRRQLAGHKIEPTQEDIAVVDAAIHEYAVGLFHYLHEHNPESLYSVTTTVDKVVIHRGASYPIQVDVTFAILYNEPPDSVPSPEEIVSILQTAYSSDEFMYFYLMGRGDIWSDVTDVKVEPNFDTSDTDMEPVTDAPANSNGTDAETPMEPVSPDVEVHATMIYDFGVDPTAEPSDMDYNTLIAVTQSFFTDVLRGVYRDNADTTFEEIILTREATTFDIEATPPAILDYFFLIKFDESSQIIPSNDELFNIMAAGDQTNMFDSYIRLYLERCECVWSTVDRVAFLETMSSSAGTTAPYQPDMVLPPLPPPAFSTKVTGSMIHSFFPDSATEPQEQDFEKLKMATSLFFTETLTKAYTNNTDVNFTVATTEITDTIFTEGASQPLQVDYEVAADFEGSPGLEGDVFAILQNGDYDSYIMEYLWPEGAPWTNVNGVMFVNQTEPPTET